MNLEVGSAAIFGVAAAATFLVTFAVRRVAVGRGLIVMPDSGRMHKNPTPTAGGVALAVGFAVAVVVAGQFGVFRADFLGSSSPAGVVLAVAVMGLLGLIDDIRSVSPPAKVAGQVLAGMVLYFFGVTMTHFKVPFLPGYIVLSSSILPLVTALWVVGIANAVNLIDGLDGLAAGVVAIASGALCIYGIRLIDLRVLPPNDLGPLIAAACCGICVGFLPHNFHRAKIFMGDTGAMILGLLMAAATMEIGGQAATVYSGATYFFFAPLVVPFVILGVPILDTAFAVVRRTIRRTKVTERDLEHLHYRLMRLGHGHRRAVVLMWSWTLVLSALVLYPTFYPRWNGVLPFAVVALGVALVTVFRPRRTRHGELTPAPVLAETAEVSPDGPIGPESGAARGGPAVLGTGVAVPTGGPRPPDPKKPQLDATHADHDPTAEEGLAGGAPDAYRRAHRRRFARHHPPMRG